MSIGLLLLVALVAGAGALWYFNRSAESTDLNNDGKTDVKDALVAVDKTVVGLKAAADVNKDGKVSAGDVKVVAEKVKKVAKKAPAKIKEATATKKPKAKK